MRVVLIKGLSTYDALRVFIDEVAEAFQRRGDQVVVIDLQGLSEIETLLSVAAREPVDLVFSFNILAEWRDAQGRSIGQILDAPHVFHYVDHPFDHLPRLEAMDPASAVLTIDRSHADAVIAAFAPGRFGHVGFCAHGAIGQPAPVSASADDFLADRPIPVLFAGTFYKGGEREWAHLSPGVQRVFDEAVAMASSVEWMSATLAMDAAMVAQGFDPDHPDNRWLRKHSNSVHEHVRAHRRFDALKAAAKAGVPLRIYGKGYEKHLYRFKNVTYEGPANFHEVVARMRESRVVLNLNANFGAGSHERPLTALMAGAAVWTDASSFYDEHFVEGQELGVFRWKALDEGMAALAELAANPRRARDIAMAGQARVVGEHCWDHRLPTIIAAAEAVRASGNYKGSA